MIMAEIFKADKLTRWSIFHLQLYALGYFLNYNFCDYKVNYNLHSRYISV